MAFDHETILAHLFAARTRLCAAAYAVVRDPQIAEDIFQNVAVKALTKDVRFEHEAALLSWAMVSVKREGIDWVRKSRPESVGLGEALLDLLHQEWMEESSSQQEARRSALRHCLEQVPSPSRQLLEFRYFEGKSCAEVARLAGISLEATYQRLSRLHRQLKGCIDQRISRRIP